jgi:AraC family transcriptional regulator, ethanolamine operon transcriptional activator
MYPVSANFGIRSEGKKRYLCHGEASSALMIRHHLELQESEILSDMSREKGFDIHCDQMEEGRLDGIVDFAGTSDVHFFRDRFGRAICNHGTVPRGMAAFTFPTTPAESAVFCGEPVTSRTLCVIAAGDEYSYRAPAGHGILGGCIAADRLDRALLSLNDTTLESVLPRTTNALISPATMARMRAATLLPFARQSDPHLLLYHDALDREVEDSLLAAFRAALTSNKAPRPTPLASRNRWRYVRAVRNHIEAHLGDPLRIETLCQIAGVSERTLETSFREVTYCSPRQFIKIRRLNTVRHALIRSRRGETSVKAIAIGCGFWHMGHFAHDYLAHFGESPSASLARLRVE